MTEEEILGQKHVHIFDSAVGIEFGDALIPDRLECQCGAFAFIGDSPAPVTAAWEPKAGMGNIQ